MASLSPTKVAKVHGYVQALSPMKQSSAGTSKFSNASNEHVTQAVVKGIKHLDVFRACYSCTGKVAETSEVLGDCTRCGVTQKIETCKLRFHARVDLQSEGNLITVTAFTPILENMSN